MSITLNPPLPAIIYCKKLDDQICSTMASHPSSDDGEDDAEESDFLRTYEDDGDGEASDFQPTTSDSFTTCSIPPRRGALRQSRLGQFGLGQQSPPTNESTPESTITRSSTGTKASRGSLIRRKQKTYSRDNEGKKHAATDDDDDDEDAQNDVYEATARAELDPKNSASVKEAIEIKNAYKKTKVQISFRSGLKIVSPIWTTGLFELIHLSDAGKRLLLKEEGMCMGSDCVFCLFSFVLFFNLNILRFSLFLLCLCVLRHKSVSWTSQVVKGTAFWGLYTMFQRQVETSIIVCNNVPPIQPCKLEVTHTKDAS